MSDDMLKICTNICNPAFTLENLSIRAHVRMGRTVSPLDEMLHGDCCYCPLYDDVLHDAHRTDQARAGAGALKSLDGNSLPDHSPAIGQRRACLRVAAAERDRRSPGVFPVDAR
ncbi:hypothetical protein PSAB6_250178 [Paraburkholderia sabiae]|nr:hypothetical protein PSAB6_250178 [Paraburkholderia sabiae]